MRSLRSTFFSPVLLSIVTASLLVCGIGGCGNEVNVVENANPAVCGSSVKAVAAPTQSLSAYTGVVFGGEALAGKQPLAGASVELYAAGTAGNGSSATALLSSALTTGSNGAFTVAAGYVCPSASSQIYVVARGGTAGTATSSNSAVVLLSALGACNQVVASSQIVVNEATTVAAAYALSQFLSAGANVGASSTNTVGLANAVATALALADTSAGVSPGPTFAANGSSPAAKIDAIANMLNACVVSSPAASACSGLFAATTPAKGSAPANTLDAALNLVRNPGLNVASLYTLSSGSSAFAPVPATAPSDWTLFVNYTGGGMDAPSGLGIDSSGDVWVASYFNVASVFSPIGKPLFAQGITGFGLSASYGLAVDGNNDAWIPNQPSTTVSGSSVSVLSSNGQSVAGSTGYTAGGLDYPTSVAIDTDNSVWVVDYGNSYLTHLSGTGQPLSGSMGYTSTQLAFPVTAAIDGSHNVWVADQSGGTVTRVKPDGSQFTSYVCCDLPSSLAIDQLGNVWVANYYGNSISEVSCAGVVVAAGTYAGGGIDHPQGLAIDGSGNVWIANFRGVSITELAGATASSPGTLLTPAAGLGGDADLVEAYAIAADASGNLWITNFGSDILTEFIGLAVPVKTPLIALPATP
jgi:streptogramin lyase